MRWHLVGPDTQPVRSCEAQSLAEARVRLRPIPQGHCVVSAVSHRQPLPAQIVGTLRERLSRTKTREQQMRSERNKRYQRRKRGENIPKMAKGTPNEKLRRFVLEQNVQGMSDSAMARRVKLSVEGVRCCRLLLGLPNVNDRMAMSITAYKTLGYSDQTIAERLGIWQASVSRILRRANTNRKG